MTVRGPRQCCTVFIIPAAGFVEEMRFVAMKLHTKDQAPKEGGKEAAKQPFQQWKPTKEGFLRFLVESKVVYDTIERVIQEAPRPEFKRFQDSGLERAGPLEQDIQHLSQEYNLQVPQPAEDGPGRAYARLLSDLARDKPEVFICHFYNTYFAHTAGGRMIGAKVSSMVLDNKQLQFYKYRSDVKQLLENVRDQINEVADGWTREQKDHCLEETEKAFSVGLRMSMKPLPGALHRLLTSRSVLQYAGGLMRCITE
eukprot:jgi/Astpho2/1087/e_gw1.00019.8.1_t